ncbi:MAG: Eco57I restriction-modification methylase domain-containing protein [Candidatus Aenigmatarchaeota archaeon]
MNLSRNTSVEKARTKQRNYIRDYLLGKHFSPTLKDAALVAFVSPERDDWRFSFVRIDFKYDEKKNKIKDETTPARRYSFLVGKNEKSHTPQERFLKLLVDEENAITLDLLEEAFSVETITEEFFEAYRYALNYVLKSNLPLEIDVKRRHTFSQLLLSRILFIYYLQRKGWLKWNNYVQDKNYLKNLWLKYKNYAEEKKVRDEFYSKWLSSLFFGAFNKKSLFIDKELPLDIQESFRIMPYLNGGLFTKNEVDEVITKVPDSVFEWLFEPDFATNDKKKGFLEIFNFTIDESMPLDVEVAVDPEMLGKVYESLINEEERSNAGIFYTPRVEIDLMCRLSLIEYLSEETKIEKSKIINFVYDPNIEVESFSFDELRIIKVALDKVKIVDPAVGSASFLVGMMNILVDLHVALTRKLERRDENIFALKGKILQENLYGVDVKDWAVMVGELRLWLSLILETDEKYMDIYTKPLLPNLSFKLRQGDSLVEEIGGIQISFRGEQAISIPSPIKAKIKDLADRKNAFYSGQRSANLKEIKEIEDLEQEILRDILNIKLEEIKRKLTGAEERLKSYATPSTMFGGGPDKALIKKIKEGIKSLETEKLKLEKLLLALKSKTQKDYFLWEIDFSEVFFENGGFDIVIGNPPYVRQESIAPPLENKADYSDDEWLKLKSAYKEKLVSSVKNIWGERVKNIDKRSDLYVYFYFHGLSLLREGGVFCFINSNSWLDVDYGAELQEFLLKYMKPLHIIDNLKKRSFKEADVNTIIALIQKPKEILDDFNIRFVAFKKPFEDLNNAKTVRKVNFINEPLFGDEDVRIYPKSKKELLFEGSEFEFELDESDSLKIGEQYEYVGNKWGGKYLRAPEIYFKILEKGKGKLVRLGDIAEIRRGLTTGANDFFYLKPVGMTVKEVAEVSEKEPSRLIRVRNGACWEGEIEAEFLKPVIKSPRELKTIIVNIEDLNNLVFMCHRPKSDLIGTKALEYIKWGEKQGFNKRPTCKSRRRWWELELIDYQIVYPSTHNPSWFVFLNKDCYCIDKVFYGIKSLNYESLCSFMNSTFCLFQSEFFGYSLVGGGGSFSTVVDLTKMLVITSYDLMFGGNFAKVNYEDIFTELGFDPNKPIREQEPNPLPDRKALDDIVFDELGLTEDERKELYWSVAELVKNRLDKARSL